MRILVTGGAGYVGNLLCRALLDAGHEVTIVDNFLYGYHSVLHLVPHPRFHVVKRDIRDADRDYLKGQDVVFHLAAISGYPACEANPNSAHLINVQATRDLIDAMEPGQWLIYASTTSLYGAAGGECREDGPVDTAHNLYAATKHEAECAVMQRENAIALRWATVFGVSPRMREGLLLNDFVHKAVQERTLVIYSPGSRRTFMHVRDSVAGYLFALEHADAMRGQIFNMGDARYNHSKRELAHMIRRYVDFEIVESGLADEDIRDFVINFDKVAALGFHCRVSMDEGVRELVKLYCFYAPHAFYRPI